MVVARTTLAAFLLVATLDGCGARSGDYSFSIIYSNCQPHGLVFMSFEKSTKGTICGPISEQTANYVCHHINSGFALDFGTAASKGKPGGSGPIAVRSLDCSSGVECSFSKATEGCMHSEDIIIQCTGIPCISPAMLLLVVLTPIVIVVVCCIVLCCCIRSRAHFKTTPEYNVI